jgi:ATP-dependent helicase YprA (DUF1998 family)
MLPRQKKNKTKRTGISLPAWKGLREADLIGLIDKLKTKFKIFNSPRKFQVDAIEAQLLRRDVLVHAGTGSGKTTIAAGPHAHEKAEGMVTFMVSPLIVLQEEQVSKTLHWTINTIGLTCGVGNNIF